MNEGGGERQIDELVPALRGLGVEDSDEGLAGRQQVEGQQEREGQRPPEAAAQQEHEEGPEGRRTTRRTGGPPAQRRAEEGAEEQEERQVHPHGLQQVERSPPSYTPGYKGVWWQGAPTQPGDWVAMEWPLKGHWQQGQVLVVLGADAAWVRVQWRPSTMWPQSRWGTWHESWEARAKLWRYGVPEEVD